MKKVVVGDILVQDNQDRKFGSDNQYAVVWVMENGIPTSLALTKEEFERAALRAYNNSEDIPELGSETSINEFDAE